VTGNWDSILEQRAEMERDHFAELQAIGTFAGPYAFLSDFHPSPVTGMGDGITYPTGEHAFQAQKTRNPDIRRRIAAYELPGGAKNAGRQVDLRPDWEQIKKQVMLRVVLAKFARSRRGRLCRLLGRSSG
jgi:ribA/ribD-fused uncharacterized protein